MSFQELEASFLELAEACEQLPEVLRAEREAMRSLRGATLEAISDKKGFLLSSISIADEGVREQLGALAKRLACPPENLFALPEAKNLRRLKARVEAAGEVVRNESVVSQLTAEHCLGFIKELRQALHNSGALGYGHGFDLTSGVMVHHIC